MIDGGECIIMATSGMLEGGPITEYFKHLASDPRNAVTFVSYQIEGTLGRRLQKGLREVQIMNSDGKIEVIKVNLTVKTIEGFSGHSDRRQIISYIRRISPKLENVIVCHGEKEKCMSIAEVLQKRYKLNVRVPNLLESVRLR